MKLGRSEIGRSNVFLSERGEILNYDPLICYHVVENVDPISLKFAQ